MTEDIPRPEEVAGQSYLGVDAEGNHHYTPPFAAEAHVVADRTHQFSTEIPSVQEYVEHVASEVGWQELRYSDEPLGVWIAEQMGSREVA